MARMTAEDFVTIAREALGGETTEAISDATILRFVNQSYLEICSRYPFPELSTTTTLTTADGTAEYATTKSDILSVSTLTDSTNYVTMQPISEAKYLQYTQGDSTSTGTPYYWYISGSSDSGLKNFTVYPTPGGVYTITIHYDRVPTELVIDPTATSPIIPAVWDDSILSRTIYRGWRHLGDENKAAFSLQVAKDNDKGAVKRSIYTNYEPWTTESKVAKALNG